MRDLLRSAAPAGALLLSLSLEACVNWKFEPASPAVVIDQQHPSVVRVMRQDGTLVTVNAPFIAGDTLRGEGVTRAIPIKIPLSDVREVATSHVDPAKSVLMTLVVGAAAFGVVVLYALSQLSGTD